MEKSSIKVVYVGACEQQMVTVSVPLPATIEQVIRQSQLLEAYPEIDLAHNKVGIFGRLKNLTDIVEAGDRIEIYRALLIDPKEMRRQNVKYRKQKTG